MAKILNDNMNANINRVTECKKQFHRIYNHDENAALDLIRKMRVIHGNAICDNEVDMKRLFEKKSIADDDFFRLSTNASVLHCIHGHIRYCEKLMFQRKQSSSQNLLPSETLEINETSATSENLEKGFGKYKMLRKQKHYEPMSDFIVQMEKEPSSVVVHIRKNKNGMDELSIESIGPERFSLTELQPEDIFSEKKSESNTQTNLTDIVNLPTSEANKLYSDYLKNATSEKPVIPQPPAIPQQAAVTQQPAAQPPATQTGSGCPLKQFDSDEIEMAIINFWSPNCSFSIKFQPEWEEFKKSAASKYPNLNVMDANVDEDKKLHELAKKVDIEGLPTLVIFYKKQGRIQKINKTAGTMKKQDVEKFIDDILRNE